MFDCPFCGTPGPHRWAMCWVNVRIAFVNASVRIGGGPLIHVVPYNYGVPPLPLFRVCRACRRRFLPQPGRERARRCWHCDYDLKGNESGVCPECGRELAPLQRALLRESGVEDREGTTHRTPERK